MVDTREMIKAVSSLHQQRWYSVDLSIEHRLQGLLLKGWPLDQRHPRSPDVVVRTDKLVASLKCKPSNPTPTSESMYDFNKTLR